MPGRHREEAEVIALSLLGGWSSATRWPLYPREIHGIHCKGGWVGLGAIADGSTKSRPTGFDPRTVQSAASRYSYNAILAAN